MDQAHEIESLMRAKYPILFITSWEERRVEACLSKISQNLKRKFFSWSLIQGSKPALAAGKTQLPPELEILAQVSEAEEYTVFLLKDFHPYLKDVRVIRLLRDLAQKLRGRAQTLVLMGPSFALPTELEKDITLIEFGLPNVEEIAVSLDRVIAAVADNPAVNTKLEPAERELLIKSAQGLTLDEIESVFARSLVQTKHLSVDAVLGEKQQIVRKSGLLEYYPADSRLKDVGGMALL